MRLTMKWGRQRVIRTAEKLTTRDLGVRILLQVGIQDCVRDLVTHFVCEERDEEEENKLAWDSEWPDDILKFKSISKN